MISEKGGGGGTHHPKDDQGSLPLHIIGTLTSLCRDFGLFVIAELLRTSKHFQLQIKISQGQLIHGCEVVYILLSSENSYLSHRIIDSFPRISG